MNPVHSNPNDHKVVSFHNKTDFRFTPDMGCMFDGRPISGRTGAGIDAGETLILPYHIGHRIATNLAKAVLVKGAPSDVPGVPTGVPIWNEETLEALKNSYITDLYTEATPIKQSETDILMAKFDELNKFVKENVETKKAEVPAETSAKTFQDKQEVIAELEVRGIKHDKRASKATLEKLLA